eukprot:1810223-Amphidinium_carterae.1
MLWFEKSQVKQCHKSSLMGCRLLSRPPLVTSRRHCMAGIWHCLLGDDEQVEDIQNPWLAEVSRGGKTFAAMKGLNGQLSPVL